MVCLLSLSIRRVISGDIIHDMVRSLGPWAIMEKILNEMASKPCVNNNRVSSGHFEGRFEQ